MKHLVGKPLGTKKVKFAGDTVVVKKLSILELREFQNRVRTLNDRARGAEARAKENGGANTVEDEADAAEAMDVQRDLIRMTVQDAEDLTDDELDGFAADDIKGLVDEILAFSGQKAEVETTKGNG